MIKEWLQCPTCGRKGDDIRWETDDEYATVECKKCGTMAKEYIFEVQREIREEWEERLSGPD